MKTLSPAKRAWITRKYNIAHGIAPKCPKQIIKKDRISPIRLNLDHFSELSIDFPCKIYVAKKANVFYITPKETVLKVAELETNDRRRKVHTIPSLISISHPEEGTLSDWMKALSVNCGAEVNRTLGSVKSYCSMLKTITNKKFGCYGKDNGKTVVYRIS